MTHPRLQARFYCNAKPWVECTNLRYHCKKLQGVDLCPEAFAEGQFPAGCSAKDFIRIDQNDFQVGEMPKIGGGLPGNRQAKGNYARPHSFYVDSETCHVHCGTAASVLGPLQQRFMLLLMLPVMQVSIMIYIP
jgi:hypothetical protein